MSQEITTSTAAGRFDIGCRRCGRLARFLEGIRETHSGYYARPVPSFGDNHARLLIVGLAPGMHGANRTGRVFTGDYAGILLYKTLFELGLCSKPESLDAEDNLRLFGCRITNAVKCLPPSNKPNGAEINECNGFLAAEIAALPDDAVILALGAIAHRAVLKALGEKLNAYTFGHGSEYQLPDGRWLVDSYHCSRYNTQTKRLTDSMFSRVLKRAKILAVL